MTTQFGPGYPVREVAPAPTVRPEFTVDLRRIHGAKHEHVKATGFWAGRTKTSPGFAKFRDRGGRHRATLQPLNRDGWAVADRQTVEVTRRDADGMQRTAVLHCWTVTLSPGAIARALSAPGSAS